MWRTPVCSHGPGLGVPTRGGLRVQIPWAACMTGPMRRASAVILFLLIAVPLVAERAQLGGGLGSIGQAVPAATIGILIPPPDCCPAPGNSQDQHWTFRDGSVQGVPNPQFHPPEGRNHGYDQQSCPCSGGLPRLIARMSLPLPKG